MCTLIYAELGVSTGVLRFACAGHPPPVLARPGQEPGPAWGGRSTPLDAYGVGAAREEATESLPPGGMILLYTDGLVEQRSRPLDQGMEHLSGLVSAHHSAPLSTMLDRLLRELPDPEHGDDVCVLAARLAPAE